MADIDTFLDLVKHSDNIVFFGGAGVSTESGIPDFRSTDGLYHQHYKYPPETMLSHTFYEQHMDEFYRFYRDKMLALDAQPNMAHIKLAELEQAGKLKAIVTQNIDGLHQKAGSKNVLELHGSVHRNYCQHCHKLFSAEYIKNSTGIPHCDDCGGTIKPDVVLYEEGLDNDTVQQALYYIIITATSWSSSTNRPLIWIAGQIWSCTNRSARYSPKSRFRRLYEDHDSHGQSPQTW